MNESTPHTPRVLWVGFRSENKLRSGETARVASIVGTSKHPSPPFGHAEIGCLIVPSVDASLFDLVDLEINGRSQLRSLTKPARDIPFDAFAPGNPNRPEIVFDPIPYHAEIAMIVRRNARADWPTDSPIATRADPRRFRCSINCFVFDNSTTREVCAAFQAVSDRASGEGLCHRFELPPHYPSGWICHKCELFNFVKDSACTHCQHASCVDAIREPAPIASFGEVALEHSTPIYPRQITIVEAVYQGLEFAPNEILIDRPTGYAFILHALLIGPLNQLSVSDGIPMEVFGDRAQPVAFDTVKSGTRITAFVTNINTAPLPLKMTLRGPTAKMA